MEPKHIFKIEEDFENIRLDKWFKKKDWRKILYGALLNPLSQICSSCSIDSESNLTKKGFLLPI